MTGEQKCRKVAILIAQVGSKQVEFAEIKHEDQIRSS